MTALTMAQQSFDINGLWNSDLLINSELTSENNFPAASNVQDWLFSVSYGSEFSARTNSYLNEISAIKSFGNHLFKARYSPGFQKEFLFSTGQSIILSDTSSQSLKADYVYKELFGFGYSYNLNEKISFGFNLKFFNQTFTQEVIKPVFSDTNYLVIETEKDEIDLWKADLGMSYKFSENFLVSFASLNLLTSESNPQYDYNKNFLLNTDRSFSFAVYIKPLQNSAINFIYETDNSFAGSLNHFFKLNGDKIGISITAYHDKFQNPFINSISPSLVYSSKYFDVALSGIKYFEKLKDISSFQKFSDNGIKNLLHNQFSFDRVNLTFNFKLNTKAEQQIKILEAEIKRDIFPALSDEYLDKPIAIAKVVNLTEKLLTVKPAIKINGINKDLIQLGNFQIAAFDTAEIPVYAFIPENIQIDKPTLSYAEIYFFTNAEQQEDEIQKPILVNSINSWDGEVRNLRYFIKKDLAFTQSYAKQLLSNSKSQLDTLPNSLADFYKAKIIFNNIIKNLTYVSDPRIKWDFVQYPSETLKLKGGDCDDLSVLFSSLLESIGIETALIDYRSRNDIRHVNVMINTRLSPNQASLITENDSKYFIRKNASGADEVWIVIETTSLTDFDTAWSLGSEIFNGEALDKMGLLNGDVQIIDVY
ncbi:MAG: transglutaminase domain-containing protein [Ignavibacterium sp.]|jgi:hypothetical protein|uniref:transglutaminase-like domain-containing protein n=1 Tax=Ignavibacterium sp. TaxID=2651167 RepID=UPI00329A00DD